MFPSWVDGTLRDFTVIQTPGLRSYWRSEPMVRMFAENRLVMLFEAVERVVASEEAFKSRKMLPKLIIYLKKK